MISSDDVVKPIVIFVLGRPGAGKGTLCAGIVKIFGFTKHLSAGEILREEKANPESEYREEIEKHFQDKRMVPAEITCFLIEQAMNKSDAKIFLIDGFPPDKSNLESWTKQFGDKVSIPFVLFLDAPEDLCKHRCLQRGLIGSSGRSDDNLETLKRRMGIYNSDTMPIINYFSGLGLVWKIDASGDPEEVFDQIKEDFADFVRSLSS